MCSLNILPSLSNNKNLRVPAWSVYTSIDSKIKLLYVSKINPPELLAEPLYSLLPWCSDSPINAELISSVELT